ncbi:deoxyguanosinetriphosphate triphosphohydrolase [Opitutales bacterium ASA1]|uniref:dGTP triphosphohydrolase n=1 Tax=Congregicoccus parvus TaxID=3081749 RepID=UPI002B2C91FF|nr:deoxyguanosinetriphosphate triphosphohydrolase [Opitutales bacterium ASA1]
MNNAFYRDFDFELLPGSSKRPEDYRTPFQVDRDRIIYSSAFRKLQSKTQVFLSGEFDFYRTRLTHSIEVAQIGRSICHFLLRTPGGPLRDDFHVDPDLVEAVCLAHDLGHPPFGHAGERKLHELMHGNGGFEGNAQTLRLLTRILYVSEEKAAGTYGMTPTRAFMDGVMKYKTLLSETPDADNHYIYDEQLECRRFVLDAHDLPEGLVPGESLNAFKSIECQIMDWADDTAYSLNDIIDGVRAGFLTFEKMEKWASRAGVGPDGEDAIRELEDAIRKDRLEAVFSRKIGQFIRACRLEPWDNPLATRTQRYAWKLHIDATAEREVAFYKRMAYDIIFTSPQLYQMEHKGRAILEDLFEAFLDNYLPGKQHPIRVLPPVVAKLIEAEPSDSGKIRRVCDHVAGMTDGLARRTWKRLFDPDFASIVDLG